MYKVSLVAQRDLAHYHLRVGLEDYDKKPCYGGATGRCNYHTDQQQKFRSHLNVEAAKTTPAGFSALTLAEACVLLSTLDSAHWSIATETPHPPCGYNSMVVGPLRSLGFKVEKTCCGLCLECSREGKDHPERCTNHANEALGSNRL